MAAGKTYEPIATVLLNSPTTTISFSSISGSYTDLIISGSCRIDDDTSGARNLHLRFNDDSNDNYNYMYMLGDGSSPGSGRERSTYQLITSSVGNDQTSRYSAENWQICNYSNTTTFKTVLMRHMVDFGNQVQVFAGLWRSTAAITKVSIIAGGAKNWASGSTFTLYGITAA